MKTLATAALAAIFTTSAAYAAMDTGTIKAINPSGHLVTLADGKVFSVPTSWHFEDYKIGDKVKVTYETKNGKMTASEIVHSS